MGREVISGRNFPGKVIYSWDWEQQEEGKRPGEPKVFWNHVGDQGLVFHYVAKLSFFCGDPQWLQFKGVPREGEAAGKGSILLNLEFDKEE